MTTQRCLFLRVKVVSVFQFEVPLKQPGMGGVRWLDGHVDVKGTWELLACA